MNYPLAKLGRYLLLDRISIGGMAEIFRAKAIGQEGFEKVVAVKRILPQLAGDDEFVRMFIDEARTVAQLNHANICQIYELGEEQGTYFIAMELVEGKDLKQIMKYHRIRGKPVPLPMALHIISHTCNALDYAHECLDSEGKPLRIVHRDVSPENILVSYDGEVKLIDFGIAKVINKLSKTTGTIKGKYSYMSPEQVAGEPVDCRSDLFACGIVLYELLTNTRLFKGESDMATLQLIHEGEVPAPSRLRPDLPERLDQIVMKALSRSSTLRHSTAGQLLDDLEQLSVDAGYMCSSQQLSRWINDVFDQDRRLAQARAREAEERVISPSPSGHSDVDGEEA